MSKQTKSALHERWPVCLRAVLRRRMPLAKFEPFLWKLGEPDAWGDPPSGLPVVVENDFITGRDPVRFPSNQELSGEGYLVAPSAEAGAREPIVVVLEESGLEFYFSPKDVDRGAVRSVVLLLDRYVVDVLHDWAMVAAIAVRRPGWELTLDDERFPRSEWADLAAKVAAVWKDVDRDPKGLVTAAKLPADAARQVSGGLAVRA